MKLILPVAGNSSRYPEMRPKWLLTHPNGNFMILESILGFKKKFEDVYLICLQSHIDKYKCEEGIVEQFSKVYSKENIHIVKLKEETKSQPETVYCGLIEANIEGSFAVKDCDNQFDITPIDGNFVAISNLNKFDMINARNKSYVMLDENSQVENIVEKNVISSNFCVGCYGFSSVENYKNHFQKLSLQTKDSLYLSDIIFSMIFEGETFQSIEVENYLDWGTIDEWKKYTRQFAVLFIDIDGTLVENSAEYFEPKWGTTNGIQKNIDVINKLYDSGKVQIILTTSRKGKSKDITVKQLERIGLKYHKLILDIIQAQRIIINDYSNSNPFRSCDAINLKRNDNNLDLMLSKIIG